MALKRRWAKAEITAGHGVTNVLAMSGLAAASDEGVWARGSIPDDGGAGHR